MSKKCLFSICALSLVVLANATADKRIGFELGIEYEFFENTSTWNMPDMLDMSNNPTTKYIRYNDQFPVFGFKFGILYEVNRLLTILGSFGFGYLNLDADRDILIFEEIKNKNYSFDQTMSSTKPEIGVMLRIIDISFMGSGRNDVSLSVEGRFGVEQLTIDSVGLAQYAVSNVYFVNSNSGWYMNYSYGINICITDVLGISAGLQVCNAISAIPKSMANGGPTAGPYICVQYYFNN